MKINKRTSNLNSGTGVLIVVGWLAIAPLLTSSLFTYFIIENEMWFASFDLLHWLAFFTLTVFTMAFAFTPTTYIAIVTGYFLGLEGSWLVILSYQLASVLGYYLSKKLNLDFKDKLISRYPKAQEILSRVGQRDFSIAVLSRLSPALPFAMMNVVLAVAKVRFSSFFFGGLVGMLPRTMFFIWVGSQAVYLRNAITHNEGLGWVIGLTAAVFAAFYFMLKPARQKTL